jgi:hypothetical protein
MTAMVPIVMVGTPEPVRTGIITDLARPEGNVTGVTTFAFEILSKAWAKRGLLLGYGQDINEAMACASEYVDKILRGARPSEQKLALGCRSSSTAKSGSL